MISVRLQIEHEDEHWTAANNIIHAKSETKMFELEKKFAHEFIKYYFHVSARIENFFYANSIFKCTFISAV